MKVIQGVVLAGLVAVAGCAGNSEMSAGAEDMLIVVENNLAPSTAVTIFAVQEGTASRRRVGFIGSNQTREVYFRGSNIPTRYFLVAEPQTEAPAGTRRNDGTSGFSNPTRMNSDIVSAPVELYIGRDMFWDLSANVMVPYEDDGSGVGLSR